MSQNFPTLSVQYTATKELKWRMVMHMVINTPIHQKEEEEEEEEKSLD